MFLLPLAHCTQFQFLLLLYVFYAHSKIQVFTKMSSKSEKTMEKCIENAVKPNYKRYHLQYHE